jgi:hypothetical protein
MSLWWHLLLPALPVNQPLPNLLKSQRRISLRSGHQPSAQLRGQRNPRQPALQLALRLLDPLKRRRINQPRHRRISLRSGHQPIAQLRCRRDPRQPALQLALRLLDPLKRRRINQPRHRRISLRPGHQPIAQRRSLQINPQMLPPLLHRQLAVQPISPRGNRPILLFCRTTVQSFHVLSRAQP